VGPDYFRTMGITVLRGREFTQADRAGAPAVLIVNDTFARRYLTGENPIGRQVTGIGQPGTAYEVVGVVSNSKYQSLAEVDEAAVYSASLAGSRPNRLVHLLVRTAGAQETVGAAVRSAVLAADASTAITITPLRSAVAFAELPSRMGSAFLGLLGALGTVLAMVGLFGVVSFAVSRRTSEIAIRMALGASRHAVLSLVLRSAGGLIASGLVAGLAIASLMTGPLAAFLVSGVSPTDPWSFGGAALLLLLASVAAIWGPALKAIGVAPATALKID
jgi:putative ABC transport system permease protein